VIFMATLAELPAAEVARLLGLSEGNAISQRLYAARTALRRLLGGRD
jgi:DNA-directed RNA polymerase specialized sigma24 family protein